MLRLCLALVLLAGPLVAPLWAEETAAKPKEGEAAASAGDAAKDEGGLPANQERVYSPTETQLLMELEQQRVELERHTQAVELREKLVDLMEQRLNGRVAELQALKTELEGLLKNVSGKDDKELDQLASIYGAMKPATAAGVLNKLDNAIVLDVLKRMPPKKSGKIMESLDPAKARVLSEMMADQTPLPQVSPTTPL
ncbi:MAG: hypothetical protein GC129_03110 [Proteobacteria bacterium]|nr:hypothetical protein [Pseudomonadota bacterium]